MTDARPELPRASRLARRHLFGLDFVDEPDLRRVIADILEFRGADDGLLPAVVTPNVDYLVRRKDALESAVRVLARARWCLPDGQPIVWASRLVGRPLAARLPGSGLVEALWADPDVARLPFAVIASNASIAALITAARPQSLVIVAPMLSDHDPSDCAAFIERHIAELVTLRPAFVYVGIGFPKDLIIVEELLSRWPSETERPITLSIGAAFELLFGQRKRAPTWMQRAGLEWLFRFVQEPRRLFARYFVRNPAFLVLVAQEWRGRERHRRSRTV